MKHSVVFRARCKREPRGENNLEGYIENDIYNCEAFRTKAGKVKVIIYIEDVADAEKSLFTFRKFFEPIEEEKAKQIIEIEYYES